MAVKKNNIKVEGEILDVEPVVSTNESVEPSSAEPTASADSEQPTDIALQPIMEQVYSLMDKKDAEYIEATLKGLIPSDKLVYRFKIKVRVGDEIKEQEVKGLTALGVREVVRFLNAERDLGMTILPNVRVTKEVIGGEEYIIAIATAKDKYGNYWTGAAQQPVKMKVRRVDKKTGKIVEKEIIDPFAVAKAVTKAQRNALRGLFPEPLVTELVERFTQEGKVEDITLNGTALEQPQQQEQQPKEPTPQVELTPEEELRQVWRQIYREAAKRFGDTFKSKLLAIVKEEYAVNRLELPLPLAKDLLERLRSGEFDEPEDLDDDFVF